MTNLRTHMWLCLALGVFQLIAMGMAYYVMIEMSQSASGIYLPTKLVQLGIISIGLYMAYFLIVLYKAIKFTPSKA